MEFALEDMHQFYSYLRQCFPETLSFSLGSFLLREYLNRYAEPVPAR